MFDMCKPKTTFWDAVRDDKLQTLIPLIPKHKCSTDHRPTKQEDNIFQGFTALHYACYLGRADFVKELLPYEAEKRTRETIKIKAPGLSAQANYFMSAGSTCLQVALMANQPEIAKMIIEYAKENPAGIINCSDDKGFYNVTVAAMLGSDVALEVLRNELFREEMTCEPEKVNPLMNACYFGRPKAFKVIRHLRNDQSMRKLIYQMALTKDASMLTPPQLAAEDIQFEKFGTTKTDKTRCLKYAIALAKEAIAYFKEKGYEDELIEAFNEAELPSMDVFGVELEDSESEASAVEDQKAEAQEDEDEYYEEEEGDEEDE